MSMAAKKEDNISRGDRVVARNDLLGYFYLGINQYRDLFEIRSYKY